MSNKDIRILLNTPSKEEGEEQLDELLPLAAGALKLGYKGLKGGVKAVGGALKLGANALTGAAAIGAKAIRKGVEAGASGDIKKLGTKVDFGRRGEIKRDIKKLGNKVDRGRRRDNRRRGAEAEAIAQSVADKLGKAQNDSGSQTNEPEPKQPPEGAQTAAQFDKENEPNSRKVVIRSNTPYPKYRKGLKRLSRGGSPQVTKVRRASMELTKQQKKAGMSRSDRGDVRQNTTDKRFS